MLYWTEYKGHEPRLSGTKIKYDNNIYTFDIETSSYLILDGKIYKTSEYNNMTKKEQERCLFQSIMYIWQFSINDTVYYGRTWQELRAFMSKIDETILDKKNKKVKKFLFIHNASYEFQFMRNEFLFNDVFSRKSHKVIKCTLEDFNFEIRCSYFMSNSSLDTLAKNYHFDTQKLVGNLDYSLIRTPKTPLTKEELDYCENDCLIVYNYICSELDRYIFVKDIPITSTGHVRRELHELIDKNYRYRNQVRKSINIDGHVYNLLNKAFSGGYVHSNWVFTDEIIDNVVSYDFTSSYPFVLLTEAYPSTEFRKRNLNNFSQILPSQCYIFVIRFYNIESRYFNNIISLSKCSKIKKFRIDNGRIISADFLEIVITDVDLEIIRRAYKFKSYEIVESYSSFKSYLPKELLEFILDKYVLKTKLKNVEGEEINYLIEKGKFNSIYGMAVTNTIKSEVTFDNETGWKTTDIDNDTILDLLNKEKKKAFLSFSYGVFCTAYARRNLISNLLDLDKYVVYSDTDSLKLRPRI